MKVYLDHNLIVYLRKDLSQELTEKIDKLKRNGCEFIFSPAHLEEVAVSFKRSGVSKEVVDSDIKFLTSLCHNNSLRPVTRDEVRYGTEYPKECYQRVISTYELNDIAETIDERVINDANKNPAGSPKEMNNLEPTKIFNHIHYIELTLLSLMNEGLITQSEATANLTKWPNLNLKDRFCVLAHSVNFAANMLEKMGYFREETKKARSRLHDVTHMVYGRYADIFVTNDTKLLKKTQAIYSLLGIPTLVLSMDEFIQGDVDA